MQELYNKNRITTPRVRSGAADTDASQPTTPRHNNLPSIFPRLDGTAVISHSLGSQSASAFRSVTRGRGGSGPAVDPQGQVRSISRLLTR